MQANNNTKGTYCCVSMATMVTRTCHSVTIHAHCPRSGTYFISMLDRPIQTLILSWYKHWNVILRPIPVAVRTKGVGLRSVACWDWGFESCWGHGYLSSCVVYCQVEVSAPWMWVPVTTAWRVLGLRMEERPPIWRVAVNKLNKQPRTADEGWSSSLGVGRGANNPSP